MKKIGFIGMGNMAQAICSCLIQNGFFAKDNVLAYAPHYEKLKENANLIGFFHIRI